MFFWLMKWMYRAFAFMAIVFVGIAFYSAHKTRNAVYPQPLYQNGATVQLQTLGVKAQVIQSDCHQNRPFCYYDVRTEQGVMVRQLQQHELKG